MKENIIADKTFDFALKSIELYKILTEKKEFVISKQVLRSGTSIGANVTESVSAQSRQDFIHKLSISLKEARETKYWLLLLKKSSLIDICVDMYLEEIESIIKILSSIILTTKSKT